MIGGQDLQNVKTPVTGLQSVMPLRPAMLALKAPALPEAQGSLGFINDPALGPCKGARIIRTRNAEPKNPQVIHACDSSLLTGVRGACGMRR